MSSTTDFENIEDENSTFTFGIRQNFNNTTSNGFFSLVKDGIKANTEDNAV